MEKDSQAPARKILSLFTGAGFLDLGFSDEGFEAIWHSECDPAFVEGFEHAMSFAPKDRPGSRIIESCESIVEVGPNEIARRAFGDVRQRGGFGMIGGPPCPDFSVGGKNRGSKGEQGRLTEVYIDRITELQPDFFVLENVPGLVRTRKHREFFDRVLSKLDSTYLYGWRLVNALDFGAPQDRSRVIVIGFRRRLLRQIYGKTVSELPTGNWTPSLERLASYPNALSSYAWPRDSKVHLDSLPKGVPPELTVNNAFSRISGKLPADLANGSDCFRPKSAKFHWILEGDDSKKSFKRLHRWRYSPAAAYGNNEVHMHPTEPRRISVREALRIQTVPDWYTLPADMTLTKKFKTVGNGVPVVLARKIAQFIREVLDGGTEFAS